jgi:hypothetical protein
MRFWDSKVMILRSLVRKTTILWLLLLCCVVATAFVYAAIDRTVSISEEIIVVPASVSSFDWDLVNNVQFSELSENSLYQEFTAANSAVLKSLQPLETEIDADRESPLPTDSAEEAVQQPVEAGAALEPETSASTSESAPEAAEPTVPQNEVIEIDEPVVPPEVEAEPVPEPKLEPEPEPRTPSTIRLVYGTRPPCQAPSCVFAGLGAWKAAAERLREKPCTTPASTPSPANWSVIPPR